VPNPVYTIGHSTRSIAEFVDLLRTGRVDLVVDVRTVPRSRTNPQYNFDRLGEELAPYQVAHCRIDALGGLRKRAPDVRDNLNGLWKNRSFHNYADYALSNQFQSGLADLISLAGERTPAIMCAEAVWWRCHRRIIADYLLARGLEVNHLMAAGRAEAAKMTPGAVIEGARLVYPAPAQA
jgi:uncharacterized protein (DUF488 family)